MTTRSLVVVEADTRGASCEHGVPCTAVRPLPLVAAAGHLHDPHAIEVRGNQNGVQPVTLPLSTSPFTR